MFRGAFPSARRTVNDARQLYVAGMLASSTRVTFEKRASCYHTAYSLTQQINGQEHDEWAINESVHGHAHSIHSAPPPPRDARAHSQVTGPRFGNLLKDPSVPKKPANVQSVDPQQLWQNLEHEYFSRFRSSAGVTPHEVKEVTPENIKSKSASGVDLNSTLEVQHMLFGQRLPTLNVKPQEDVIGKIQKIIEEDDNRENVNQR